MKTKRLYYWLGLAAFLLIIWGLFGHFVCRIGYSTQKPVKWDAPKEISDLYLYEVKGIAFVRHEQTGYRPIYFKSCGNTKRDTIYDYENGTDPTLQEGYWGFTNSSSIGTVDILCNCLIDETTFLTVYWEPIYNHSEILRLDTAD